MKLGIYGRTVEPADKPVYENIFRLIAEKRVETTLESNFYHQIHDITGLTFKNLFHDRSSLLKEEPHVLLSLGGDGTLLDTLQYVRDTALPVMGVNLGRLGFLSNTPKESFASALDGLIAGQYRFDKRSMLELQTEDEVFAPNHYALNDFTIHKRDTGSMIAIDTYLNGEYFATYWADGIVVATPTGSTAYSLSCGGPILFPDSDTFVITPVAPHNLNSRPIIVSDSTVISFRVHGRGQSHLISLDSRYEVIEQVKEIAIQKAPFFFNLVKLNQQNFINTLREKLKWGLDTRNL